MIRRQRYIINDREQSALAESFRAIRSIIQAVTKDGHGIKTVLFAGVNEGEGSTMTAVNTAVSLAYAGNKVVLIDCNMRTPLLQELFRVKRDGVTDFINADKALDALIQGTPIANLKVLTSGPLPDRPVEVLASEKTPLLFETLKMSADYIIINSSPMVLDADAYVADACVLASKVDGVVLVIDAGTVRVPAARRALALLEGARAYVIGTVLNGVDAEKEYIY